MDYVALDLFDDVLLGGVDAGNAASSDGGGLFATNSVVEVDGNELLDYEEGTAAPDNGVRFEENTAGSLGGGIAIDQETVLSGTSLVLRENQATGSSGSGGGLATIGDSVASFEYVSFHENVARRGGGAYVSDATLSVIGTPDPEGCNPLAAGAFMPANRYCTEFTGNLGTTSGSVANAGGAVYADAASVTLYEVAIQDNDADDDASALYFGNGSGAGLRNALVAATSETVPVSVRVSSTSSMSSQMSSFVDVGTTVEY